MRVWNVEVDDTITNSTCHDSLKFHLDFITDSSIGIGIDFELEYLLGDDCMIKKQMVLTRNGIIKRENRMLMWTDITIGETDALLLQCVNNNTLNSNNFQAQDEKVIHFQWGQQL